MRRGEGGLGSPVFPFKFGSRILVGEAEYIGKGLSWVGEGGSCLPALHPVQK